jgi:2-polyprenyl-3-methyl-5-hydroxy-6-metoxy-1,4-benzoquinol methylase
MVSFDQIDWNKMWEEEMNLASGVASWSWNGAQRGINRWDEAENRPIRTGNEEYVEKLLKKLTLDKDDSVLDIGCGGGLISIPIAQKVKVVTALDTSQEVLSILQKNASQKKMANIKCLQADLQSIEPVKDLHQHDIVIASRCLGMFDLSEELTKINEMAKKRVYLTRIVEECDEFSPNIYKLLGKQFKPLPNYYFVYNLLYQLGIKANIDYISVEIEEKYKSIDHAINVWKWKLNGLTEEDEVKLKIFLDKNLRIDKNDYLSTELFHSKWALLSWTTNSNNFRPKKTKEKHKIVIDNNFNWNKVWHNLNQDRIHDQKLTSVKRWDIFANRFNQGVKRDWENKKSYLNQLLDKIEIDRRETVLDIGSGSGGITIPLAKKANRVTAIDASAEMISFLKENAKEYSINNVNSIIGQWEKIVSQPSFPQHDIVVASRCLSGFELKEKIELINKIAAKRVYFTWITEISNLQKMVFQILQRKFKQEPNYIYIFNLLNSMGIDPKIDFIHCQKQESFRNIEEAVERYQWILDGINEEEKVKLNNYFNTVYVKKEDGTIISPPNIESKWEWAVFSWEVENRKDG